MWRTNYPTVRLAGSNGADIWRRPQPPVQVRPIVVMWEVSIDFLQKQVRTFRCEVQEVCIFLWGGGTSPPVWITSTSAPLGVSPSLYPSLSASSSSAFVSYPLSTNSWLSSLLQGGVLLSCPPMHPLPPPPLPPPLLYLPPSPDPPGGSGMLSVGCQGLAARWDFPQR